MASQKSLIFGNFKIFNFEVKQEALNVITKG